MIAGFGLFNLLKDSEPASLLEFQEEVSAITETETQKPIQKTYDEIILQQKEEPIPAKPKKTEINIAGLEYAIHLQVNEIRKQNGLNELAFNEQLATIAKNHSIDMKNNNYFDHTNLKGESPADRGNNYGFEVCGEVDKGEFQMKTKYKFQSHRVIGLGIAENLLFMPSWGSDDPKSIVDGWLDSQDHKRNMLFQYYTVSGVGMAFTSNGDAYITQNFC